MTERNLGSTFRVLTVFAMLLMSGCSDRASIARNPSTNVNELLSYVKIERPIGTVKWEVFAYPEGPEGLLPDNYESKTLVAEISPSHASWLAETDRDIEIIWTSPNAARSWLTSTSQLILKSESLDLTKHKCRYFNSTLIRSNKPLTGFVCESGNTVLLYLLLDEKT